MNLANWISLSRLFLAPLIYWQLTTGTPQGTFFSFMLLILAAVTDVVDGWVARARHEISELGKILDPLGDKMVILATLLALAMSRKLPFILVLIYLLKETMQILAGVFLVKRFKQVIPANWWGKSSTVGFFAGFALFFINYKLGIIMIGAAITLSIVAFYSYYSIYRRSKRL